LNSLLAAFAEQEVFFDLRNPKFGQTPEEIFLQDFLAGMGRHGFLQIH
jgi:hypothetical protein